MATYLKRTSKLFDISVSQASAEMNLRDVICPVCRGILIEPVTLPCTHNLCLRCLKGTFEHNSLSCPLCRVRVGSWLRSATKSETLVNNDLWELIRARFPKEIEGKHNDEDNDIGADNVYPPKIISAAGEIRREYEMQLQIAEEEMRRQREAEIMANEALIRKIQEEEHRKLAQFTQDQLLAKTLAKKQLLTKEKTAKYYNCMNIMMPSDEVEIVPINSRMGALAGCVGAARVKNGRTSADGFTESKKLSKASEAQASGIKIVASKKGCCPATLPVHNAVTLKHQSVMLTQKPTANYLEPSCSNSKIYGTRSEEELRVPSDVLSSNKKSLGVEICITTIKNDDKRIGSAESAGSHDSINQEIHHFKPIKPMPRTPLRLSQDGRQIDPKLIRVVPIFKRASNAIPKAPSPSHFKRIVGCSWSAFREFLITGKTQPNPKSDCGAISKISSTLAQSNQMSKLTKASDTVRKLDLVQDVGFDNNKNYTKGINRILNGTKVSKKLVLDDETDGKMSKSAWKSQIKNSSIEKTKKYKNEKKEFSEEENSSPSLNQVTSKIQSGGDEYEMAVENIAERIKRRKVAQSKKDDVIMPEKIVSPRKTRNRNISNKTDRTESLKSKRKISKASSKSKNLNVKFDIDNETNESSVVEEVEVKKIKLTRKSSRTKGKESTDSSGEKMEEEVNEDLDDVAIKAQEKMERLLLQEKEDFELARRLQAKFNEMESISCRTRGSKRALETDDIELSMDKMRINGKLAMSNVSTTKTPTRRTKSRGKQKHD